MLDYRYIYPNTFINLTSFSGSISSLILDGVDEQVHLGDFTDLASSTELTLSTWVRYNGAPNNSQYIGYVGTSSQRTRLIFNDGDVRFQLFAGSSSYGFFPFRPILGRWYHIVGVFDGSGATNADRCKMYVNGVEIPLNFSGTIPTAISSITTLGRLWAATNEYPNNYGADGAIFNYALSGAEVGTIYNGGEPTDLLNTSGITAPIHYWRPNSADFPTIKDTGTGNANNATLVNMEAEDYINILPSENFEYSMRLDGVNESQYGANAVFSNDSFSWDTWIKPDQDGETTSGVICQFRSNIAAASNRSGMRFYITNAGKLGYWYARTNTTTEAVVSTNSFINDGTAWLHVAWVKNGTSLKLYVNGTLEDTFTLAQTNIRYGTSACTNSIGFDNSNNFYKGLIRQIGMTESTYWSDSDVITIYNSGTPLEYYLYPSVPKYAWSVMSNVADLPIMRTIAGNTGLGSLYNLETDDLIADIP